MSCEHYRQLLHLNRLGELSAGDADDLRQHLELCESCSLEWRRIQRADEFLDPLRSFSPAPPNPENLTTDIMRRVRETVSTEPPQSIIDRILDFFLIPGIRYSTVAIISFMTITLVLQSLFLLDDI
jgi:anti-sigma factor RsiW